MYSLLKKNFSMIYLTITLLIYCCSTLNYYLYAANIKIISYIIYLMVFVLSMLFSYKQINIKIAYIGGALILLTLFVVDNHFICICMLVFLYFLLKNIKKFKWLYLVFAFIWIFWFCLSFAMNFFLDFGGYSEPNNICDISPNGNKILSRDVYDVGAAGYNLTYYITEKYFLFERKYVVATRGQMSSKEENRFINEDTLIIQGIIYDISNHDVVFKQSGTGKEMHRKKRKNILFLF